MSQYSFKPGKNLMIESGKMNRSESQESVTSGACCHFTEACCFVCSNFSEKMNSDLLMGTNTSKSTSSISPNNICKQASIFINVTDEEKKESVLSDPRFGMFSLFKYHLKKGYLKKKMKKGNVYCFNIFSLFFALPILVFVAQWLMYVSLMINQTSDFDGDICPNKAPFEQKIMMVGIAILYFIRSFFIWDSFTNRTKLQKMNPASSYSVIIDTYQEFGFNLLVYVANIWLVFQGESSTDMILNSIAMEFLMELNNEYEEMYFKFLPECAIDIYDNVFVTQEENTKIVLEKKKNSCCLSCISCIFYMPFKILVLLLFFFPVFCLFMIFYGPICK